MSTVPPDANPDELVPEDDFLEIEDYLDLFGLVSDSLRFRLLYRLAQEEAVVDTLAELVDRDDSTVHYHLNHLVEAGLIENQRRRREDRDSHFSYYTATAKGEELLSCMIAHIQAEDEDQEVDQRERAVESPIASESENVTVTRGSFGREGNVAVMCEDREGRPVQWVSVEAGEGRSIEQVHRRRGVRARVEEQVNVALDNRGLAEEDFTPSSDF